MSLCVEDTQFTTERKAVWRPSLVARDPHLIRFRSFCGACIWSDGKKTWVLFSYSIKILLIVCWKVFKSAGLGEGWIIIFRISNKSALKTSNSPFVNDTQYFLLTRLGWYQPQQQSFSLKSWSPLPTRLLPVLRGYCWIIDDYSNFDDNCCFRFRNAAAVRH